jgi:23S rRNA (cytidine2498-2'-O)-methyltransferase
VPALRELIPGADRIHNTDELDGLRARGGRREARRHCAARVARAIIAALSPRLHVCPPELATRLLAELRAVHPGGTHAELAPGLISSELPPDELLREPLLAFAQQVLPAAVPLAAPSVSAWARAAASLLLPRLEARAPDAPWRLHLLRVGDPATQPGARRAALVEEALLAELKQRRRRVLRERVPNPAWPRKPGEAIAQVALQTPDTGWFSFADGDEARRLRRVLSRLPGGECPVPEDRRPPARAYRKLLEVEARWARPIAAGETCADLGAAPGSWTWVALERGARVSAVDRAPLRADLMAHPALAFVKGDAFRWLPEEPVDWLLCDVIAEPARSVGLLARWLEAGACRRFVVTVKFKGEDDGGALADLKAVLRGETCDHVVRRLDANRNEVTAYGERVEAGGSTDPIEC